jgi:subtilisin-like proprotein convertase family protein
MSRLNKKPSNTLALAGLIIATASQASALTHYPKRALGDLSTGYMQALVGSTWYRGSGVVARDPKLIYSCGHLLYDRGVWATDYKFHRAYDEKLAPDSATAASPRGFRYFTSYASNVASYGANSSRAFATDFALFYGTSSFGPAVGWWPDGAGVLTSDRSKRIVGYPAKIDHTGAAGYSYQHATDWFNNRASQVHGAYHSFSKVSTGKGNSGGPVFAWDAASNDYHLAGILVSGSSDSAGVFALNDASNAMASAALGRDGQASALSNTYSNLDSVRLRDASSTYVTREITAAGFSETITDLRFSVSITTPRRGDLDVFLRSPTGRIRWISKQSRNRSADVVIDQADYTEHFRGYAPNGVWKLRMRDAVKKNRATFNRFSITIGGAGE